MSKNDLYGINMGIELDFGDTYTYMYNPYRNKK